MKAIFSKCVDCLLRASFLWWVKKQLAEIKNLVAKAMVQVLSLIRYKDVSRWQLIFLVLHNWKHSHCWFTKNVRNTGNTSFWSLSDGFFVYSSLVFCKKQIVHKSQVHTALLYTCTILYLHSYCQPFLARWIQTGTKISIAGNNNFLINKKNRKA